VPNTTAPTALEARELIRSFFPSAERAQPSVESLASILEKFITARDLGTRLDAFAELKDWTTTGSTWPAGDRISRLEIVLALMESQSGLRARFEQVVREILTEIRSVELFAEAGLHPREGL
jgi:site-specific recombinase